jgi:hypothetical protein
MRSKIRRFGACSNIIAILALLFATSGGALAAGKFLITSTKQINPKVLKSLKGTSGKNGAPGPAGPAGPVGAAGPVGPAGAAGTVGPAGPEGKEGKEGPEGGKGATGSPWPVGELPAKATETGEWALEGVAPEPELLASPLSFNVPLKAAITDATKVHFIVTGETVPAECEGGTLTEPKAASGNLCVYAELENTEAASASPLGLSTISGFAGNAADKSGAIVRVIALEEGRFKATGSWAVTG